MAGMKVNFNNLRRKAGHALASLTETLNKNIDKDGTGIDLSTCEGVPPGSGAEVLVVADEEARAEELTKPLAGPEDMAGGWTLDARFLHMLQRMVQNENGGPGMEDIEAVLVHAPKAIERWKALRDSGKEEPNG